MVHISKVIDEFDLSFCFKRNVGDKHQKHLNKCFHCTQGFIQSV